MPPQLQRDGLLCDAPVEPFGYPPLNAGLKSRSCPTFNAAGLAGLVGSALWGCPYASACSVPVRGPPFGSRSQHHLDALHDLGGVLNPLWANRVCGRTHAGLATIALAGVGAGITEVGLDSCVVPVAMRLLVSPQLRGWSPSLRVIEGDSIHLLPLFLRVCEPFRGCPKRRVW